MALPNKWCVMCGNIFTPECGRQSLCSEECRVQRKLFNSSKKRRGSTEPRPNYCEDSPLGDYVVSSDPWDGETINDGMNQMWG